MPDEAYTLHCGDCLEVLPQLEPQSVSAVVTDPPYGLGFMGKEWDHGVPGLQFWKETLRIVKPGAYLLAFGGTRTFHRLACAIEDAGWEIRDTIMWVYGSGFPKSLDVSKAIDKAAGAEREVVGAKPWTNQDVRGGAFASNPQRPRLLSTITAPATADARQWQGWGTALKPAWEPIIVARAPLSGTVAENVLTYGTGAINVDGAWVEGTVTTNPLVRNVGGFRSNGLANQANPPESVVSQGRWPANLIHDGSDEVVALFPQDASRFFYCAKASKSDRDEGCEGMEEQSCGTMEDDNYDIKTGCGNSRDTRRRNNHPTVKPTTLMRYLVRLVSVPGAVVLDNFMGSGSTGKAALLEGRRFIGIELDPAYFAIAERRIADAAAQGRLF